MKLRALFLSLFSCMSFLLHADPLGDYTQYKQLSTDVRASLAELQNFQMEYDQDFWSINQDLAKVRHVLLHLMDSVGKLARYCETREHGKDPNTTQLINEVFPDLLMHTLQLSNAFDVNLSEKYENRINSNIAGQLLNRSRTP